MARSRFWKSLVEASDYTVLPSASTPHLNDSKNKSFLSWSYLSSHLTTASKHRRPWLKYLTRALIPAILVYFVIWPLLMGTWAGPKHALDKKPPQYKSYRLDEKKLSKSNTHANNASDIPQVKYLFVADHVQCA
jgi:hypothetical protein